MENKKNTSKKTSSGLQKSKADLKLSDVAMEAVNVEAAEVAV